MQLYGHYYLRGGVLVYFSPHKISAYSKVSLCQMTTKLGEPLSRNRRRTTQILQYITLLFSFIEQVRPLQESLYERVQKQDRLAMKGYVQARQFYDNPLQQTLVGRAEIRTICRYLSKNKHNIH